MDKIKLFVLVFIIVALIAAVFIRLNYNSKLLNYSFNGKIESIKKFPRKYEIKVHNEWYILTAAKYSTFIEYVEVGDSVIKNHKEFTIIVIKANNDEEKAFP